MLAARKAVLQELKLDMTKIDKDKDTEAKSKSSASTLKTPFTQLPTNDNTKKKDSVKSMEDPESGDCSDDDDAVKKGNDAKKKGKYNSADNKSDHVAATSADITQPNDPIEPPWNPQMYRQTRIALTTICQRNVLIRNVLFHLSLLILPISLQPRPSLMTISTRSLSPKELYAIAFVAVNASTSLNGADIPIATCNTWEPSENILDQRLWDDFYSRFPEQRPTNT